MAAGSIVLDCGSSTTQVGIAGDDCPAEIVPTLIGFNKSPPHGTPVFGKKVEEEYESRTLLRPVQKGTIVDWENYEIFLDDIFKRKDRCQKIKENGILVSEYEDITEQTQAKIAELFYEKYEAPQFCCLRRSQLSLFAAGRTTGLVVSFEREEIRISPYYNSGLIEYAFDKVPYGKEDVITAMADLMTREGHVQLDRSSFKDRKIAAELVEKFGYVSPFRLIENGLDLKPDYMLDKSYELPDGKIINIGARGERCLPLNGYFSPSTFGKGDATPLHEAVYNSIWKTPLDERVRLHLVCNIVLSDQRLWSEKIRVSDTLENGVRALIPSAWNAKVISPPEADIAAWLGGSIFASLHPSSLNRFLSRGEYNEGGPRTLSQWK